MLIIKYCAMTPLMPFLMSRWRRKVLHISFFWSMSSLNEVVVDLWLLGIHILVLASFVHFIWRCNLRGFLVWSRSELVHPNLWKGDHICHPFGCSWQHHQTLKGILKTLYEQNKSNYYMKSYQNLWIANTILSCYHINTTLSTHYRIFLTQG
jgi:hypothetical protein